MSEEFTVGDYSLSWEDHDHILISYCHGVQVRICGGDLESILSALCSVERAKP